MLRRVLGWAVPTLILIHAAIHLLGVAAGLGGATIDAFTEPISTAAGVGWLVAAALVAAAGIGLATRGSRLGALRGAEIHVRTAVVPWWVLCGVAAVASQVMVVTSWADAAAGTAPNVVLGLAAVYGYLSEGPSSPATAFARLVEDAATGASVPDSSSGDHPITEADLERLPAAVAAHVRRSGAVGAPRIERFAAEIHGRIRSGPDAPWMPFVGRQVNGYGPSWSRLLLMDATMLGLPVDVLHVFRQGAATMEAKLCSAVTVVRASGEEMTRAETVTLLNDACIMAPATLVDAPIRWEELSPHRVRATFTNGDVTISAELVFDAEGDLVDFVSDDRLRSSDKGDRFTLQRWSTPVGGHRDLHGRRIACVGEGRWHAPEPEGEFAYLEFIVDEIVCHPS